MELKDRVALVTGAASGIGRATALRLAQSGACGVAINYRTAKDEAERLATEVSGAGAKPLCVRGDVRNDGEVRRMIEQVGEHFGRLDVLVNNAGTTRWVPLSDLQGLTDEIWDDILDYGRDLGRYPGRQLEGRFSLRPGCCSSARKKPGDGRERLIDLRRPRSDDDFLACLRRRQGRVDLPDPGFGCRVGSGRQSQRGRAGVHGYQVDARSFRDGIRRDGRARFRELSAEADCDHGGCGCGDRRLGDRGRFCDGSDADRGRWFEFELEGK
ncbi:MAG: SDR family NAD(P)-dependent oxidoreductase [Deltaproteobacteria bacterium]|nr:SDR family NAD(P)-dependent oxidoreductase [Deltaproteobacteria bacterium]